MFHRNNSGYFNLWPKIIGRIEAPRDTQKNRKTPKIIILFKNKKARTAARWSPSDCRKTHTTGFPGVKN